jgi:hypothetical protein
MSGFTFSAAPSQGEYKLPPAGNHAAYCFGAVVLGSFDDEYQGQKKVVRKIRLDFELVNELMDVDGKQQPFSANIQMNISMFENSNFRKFLEAWRGGRYTDEQAAAGVDVSKFVGHTAMINLVHEPSKTGSVYANIKSIAPLPKGMSMPAMFNEKRLYSVFQHDQAAFEVLSDYLKGKIAQSKEWAQIAPVQAQFDKFNGTQTPAPAAQTTGDEPPF